MKLTLNIVGVLFIIFGAIWVLQGINVLKGDSFMVGQIKWAIYGGCLAAVGIIMLLAAARRRNKPVAR
jgi:hypothetical protein